MQVEIADSQLAGRGLVTKKKKKDLLFVAPVPSLPIPNPSPLARDHFCNSGNKLQNNFPVN